MDSFVKEYQNIVRGAMGQINESCDKQIEQLTQQLQIEDNFSNSNVMTSKINALRLFKETAYKLTTIKLPE